MEAPRSPDTFRNTCWCCCLKTLSPSKCCPECGAETTPTYDEKNLHDPRLKYRLLSFGHRANQIKCPRLHASSLDKAVEAFQKQPLCAVRVGVEPNTKNNVAPIVKDLKGEIRSTIRTPHIVHCAPWTGDVVAEFLHVANTILLADPELDKGKYTFIFYFLLYVD